MQQEEGRKRTNVSNIPTSPKQVTHVTTLHLSTGGAWGQVSITVTPAATVLSPMVNTRDTLDSQ